MLGYFDSRSRRATGAALALGLALSLSACHDMLNVDLPAQLTGDAFNDPVSAGTQINTMIVLYENSMSDFMYTIHGHEDGGEVVFMSPSIGSGIFGYTATAPDFAATTPTNGGALSGTPTGMLGARLYAKTLHDKLDKTWTTAQVPKRAQYMAISSIYEGAVYAWMAGTLCEGALDGGKLMSQADMYKLADATLTRAITEVQAAGDFAMPYGISTSALDMAYGLRAQNRWMSGDLAGAKADAEKIPAKFYAYITREATATRRNLNYYNGPEARFASLQGVVDWWKGPLRQANPATGKTWPDVIPFTGYQELGILPDGRAIRDDGLPIRLATKNAQLPQNYRTAIEDTAVPDTRVPAIIGTVGGFSTPQYIATKFSSEQQFVPIVDWKEMMLIRAEATGGQGAIDLVNQLRDADGLPKITYLSPGDANGIRYMLIEERRRALFQEGRYYYTKLKNLDLTWFPRLQGNMPHAGTQYNGGVRLAMPDNEYLLNPNILDLNKRGSGCDAASKPTF